MWKKEVLKGESGHSRTDTLPLIFIACVIINIAYFFLIDIVCLRILVAILTLTPFVILFFMYIIPAVTDFGRRLLWKVKKDE